MFSIKITSVLLVFGVFSLSLRVEGSKFGNNTLLPVSHESSTIKVETTKESIEASSSVTKDPYSGYLFYNETQSYYSYDGSPIKGPCGKFMKLFPESNNTNNGICLCDQPRVGCHGRPLVYWKETNRCYYAYDQGPCKKEEWVVYTKNGNVECQTNHCPKLDPVSESEEIAEQQDILNFYFNYNGSCYKTQTKAFCGVEENVYFIGAENTQYSVHVCRVYEPACGSGGIAMAGHRKCPPNTKPQADGGCAKIATFGG